MTDTASPETAPVRSRVILVRPKDTPGGSKLRSGLIMISILGLLAVGMSMGFRAGGLLWHPPEVTGPPGTLTERIDGGLYALELAMPQGQARWMLEFDADIITRDGPKNPQQLRDALEKLVITATSIPLVIGDPDPPVAMRKAMLAIAAEHYPWLVDIHMRRSDIRAETDKLSSFGEAMRNIGK